MLILVIVRISAQGHGSCFPELIGLKERIRNQATEDAARQEDFMSPFNLSRICLSNCIITGVSVGENAVSLDPQGTDTACCRLTNAWARNEVTVSREQGVKHVSGCVSGSLHPRVVTLGAVDLQVFQAHLAIGRVDQLALNSPRFFHQCVHMQNPSATQSVNVKKLARVSLSLFE